MRSIKSCIFAVLMAVAGTALPAAPGRAGGEATHRVSLGDDEQQANGFSNTPVLSGSGRYVMFHSDASNLVAGDTNATFDVFVRDRQRGSTVRVSVSGTGAEANGESFGEDLTSDGRYVVFSSFASNLVPGDTNGVQDIFVRDLNRGTTTRVSAPNGGGQSNFHSVWAAASADGRYVAFTSEATNLVPGDDNLVWDVFVRDRVAGTTSLISVSSNGEPGTGHSYRPRISADGRLVVFSSLADNLVPGDLNGRPDAFVRDRTAQTTRLVSVSLAGTAGNESTDDPDISGDGRYVVFWSFASDLVAADSNGVGDTFLRDLLTGTTRRVNLAGDGTQANDGSLRQVISADGRYVAFSSSATNLVTGDVNGVMDVFRHDRLTGKTILVSVSTTGDQVTTGTGETLISISADGTQVAFSSEDTHLVPADTNGYGDVFVHSC